MTQSKKMARIAYDALNEKKGEDIKIIDIAEVSTLGDYFVIANGNSSSQVTALVDNVEEEMHKAGFSLRQREGRASGSWILLDFGDVIMSTKMKTFTRLKKKKQLFITLNVHGKTEKKSR